MEFKDFLTKLDLLNTEVLDEAKKKKESTAEKDDKAEKAGKKVAKDIEYDEGHKGKDDKKAEKAGKKVAKDIEYDDKKDKKKKSLKDWIEIVDRDIVNENVTAGMKPLAVLDPTNKQAGAAVVTSKNPTVQKMLGGLDPKDVQIVMTKANQSGSTTQPAMPTAMKEEEVEESGLQAYLGNKKYGKKGMDALRKAGREGASKEKMAQIRAKHDKLDEVEKQNYWVHDEEDNEYYGPYSSETSARDGGRVGPKAKIVKHPASVRNPRSLNRSVTGRVNAFKVKKAGAYGKAMEGQLDEKAVSKKQQKFMGMVHAAQKGEKAASPEVAKVAKSMKKGDVKDFAQTKHKGLPEKKKKMKEAEIPHSGPDYGAGLGAGRSQSTFEGKKPDFLDLDKDGNKKESMKKAAADKKKKVKESMNPKLKAAYHEGYTHGLRELGSRFKHYEDVEEARQYFEGYKCGLEECYGLAPNRGLVVDEMSAPATVPGMSSQAMSSTPSLPAMEDDMGEGNAFGQAVRAAKADGIPPGEKINVGGKSYPVKEDDIFAFESLDKQLDALLNEGTQVVNEGLSVSMSQGQGMGEDSVSVTATADDAGKLLNFIKQVGLGGLGSAEGVAPAEPAVVAVSDYGAPKFNGHDDMAALMKKVGVDDEGSDYKPEGEADHEHSDTCGCEKKVDEVETADQREFQVAEDDGEGYEQSQAAAAEIDSALAKSGASKGGATNEDGAEAPGSDPVGQAEQDSAKEVDEEKEEKLDEWANEAGKKGTDAAFERDIEFMTKVISGGLNKPKSTGQTTIPVIAGQEARMGDEDVAAWKKLAGLSK